MTIFSSKDEDEFDNEAEIVHTVLTDNEVYDYSICSNQLLAPLFQLSSHYSNYQISVPYHCNLAGITIPTLWMSVIDIVTRLVIHLIICYSSE